MPDNICKLQANRFVRSSNRNQDLCKPLRNKAEARQHRHASSSTDRQATLKMDIVDQTNRTLKFQSLGLGLQQHGQHLETD